MYNLQKAVDSAAFTDPGFLLLLLWLSNDSSATIEHFHYEFKKRPIRFMRWSDQDKDFFVAQKLALRQSQKASRLVPIRQLFSQLFG